MKLPAEANVFFLEICGLQPVRWNVANPARKHQHTLTLLLTQSSASGRASPVCTQEGLSRLMSAPHKQRTSCGHERWGILEFFKRIY
ncbi:hypothetical protein V6L77_14585 [Pannonibacter sp. Pt2-lr]